MANEGGIEILKFEEKFGIILVEYTLNKKVYYCKKNNKTYILPTDASEAEIEKNIKKSLSDNHDYILDLVSRGGSEMKYRENVLY